MIISDKQELRRCVKQLVRRADVCEADLSFDVARGEVGVAAMMSLWARQGATPADAFERTTADQTPFSEDAVATFAVLDAMDLPVRDLNRAEAMQSEYERPAYIREVLDTMRQTGFSRIPVFHEDVDRIVGIAHIKDLISPIIDDGRGDEKISRHMRTPDFVPDTKDIIPLL